VPEEKPDDRPVTTKPAEPRDDVVSSKHHLQVGRATLDYTATTGRVVLREEVYEDGKFVGFQAKAEMSLTSYTLDGVAPDQRPVTFAFNGVRGVPVCGSTSACSVHGGC
jgi:carboxypeptidase C (cathepsin A)